MNKEHETPFYQEVVKCNITNSYRYDDLPGHLNEMLQDITDEKVKALIVQNINTYYNSLNTLLIKHTIENAHMSKSFNQKTGIKL